MTPFEQQLEQDDYNRLHDPQNIMTVNGSSMGLARWNLIITKRDLTLWTKMGMKPHRRWKVTDVKRYFGIKGNGQNLMDRFMKIFNEVMGE